MPTMTSPKKEVLYVELPASLKQRLARLARKRARKISAEAQLAIERYLREEEAKEEEDDEED